jgi:phage repressor protein C with HTH and peptisase S24 domain
LAALSRCVWQDFALRTGYQPKMREPRWRDANPTPAMDSRDGRFDQLGDCASPAQRVDYLFGKRMRVGHAMTYAIFATQSQGISCDNRFCSSLAIVAKGRMDQATILKGIARRKLKQVDVAEALGIEQDKVSKSLSGRRQWKADEILKLQALLGDHDDSTEHPEQPGSGRHGSYVDIPVLPSFAGMGGGGTGEGDRQIAKLPRRLIEEELRGRASDFELIDVRGDSMQPDFQHGDQILIDKRDRDPRQPGPFALYDGEGYVVKLVERIPQRRGWYRIFSANERYTPYEIEETDTTIMGRPVWFARRL